ncbi:hypothetical protein Y032_0011g1443 [Ancylostoma ceylanicum]|uniref:rhomboid protease n=1 Tax=Ancylostoma ceylanicum TaxID=53326 RepID=A0A016VFS6_9BILA|nr:hypothetical protein Y032_0011g1443 [Ancylostoma ceylanicum]
MDTGLRKARRSARKVRRKAAYYSSIRAYCIRNSQGLLRSAAASERIMLLNQLLFRVPLRGFRSKALSYGRFSRESLRNRLHRNEIKQPFKAQTPPPPYASDTIPVRPVSDLMRALGFTFAVGAGAFTVAIISDYERQSHRLKNLFEKARFSSENGWKQLTDGDKCALYLVGGELFLLLFFRQSHCALAFACSSSNCQNKTILFLHIAFESILCQHQLLNTAQFTNLVVFALWRVKRLQTFMWRYFSNSFASRSLCMPMALSVFSHYNLVHLALNMYVVWSFTNVTVDKFLGPDQVLFFSWSNIYTLQFWAFFITAGVVSSFFGLAHKALARSPIRAVGASGAILGMLGYTCMKIPEARLKIVFVPGFDFSAQSAIIGILLFDLAGLLFRFRMFDHAAHLGGTLFGVFYALIGDDLVWNSYGSVVERAYRYLKNG